MKAKTLLAALSSGVITLTAVAQDPSYVPVWGDEFDGPDIDTRNWTFDIGGNGWGNNELQYYTNRTVNSFVSGGLLHIVAREESFGGRDYTSARLRTRTTASRCIPSQSRH